MIVNNIVFEGCENANHSGYRISDLLATDPSIRFDSLVLSRTSLSNI
jgi:hypothetical protein